MKKPKPYFVINGVRIKAETIKELYTAFSWRGIAHFTHQTLQLFKAKEDKSVYTECKIPLDAWIYINMVINKSRFKKKLFGSNDIKMTLENVPLLYILPDDKSFLYEETAEIYQKEYKGNHELQGRDIDIYLLVKKEIENEQAGLLRKE